MRYIVAWMLGVPFSVIAIWYVVGTPRAGAELCARRRVGLDRSEADEGEQRVVIGAVSARQPRQRARHGAAHEDVVKAGVQAERSGPGRSCGWRRCAGKASRRILAAGSRSPSHVLRSPPITAAVSAFPKPGNARSASSSAAA